jgi:hypothetical protein
MRLVHNCVSKFEYDTKIDAANRTSYKALSFDIFLIDFHKMKSK